jgi:hypothetical protein
MPSIVAVGGRWQVADAPVIRKYEGDVEAGGCVDNSSQHWVHDCGKGDRVRRLVAAGAQTLVSLAECCSGGSIALESRADLTGERRCDRSSSRAVACDVDDDDPRAVGLER